MAPGKRKAPSSPLAPVVPGSPRFLPCPICGKSFVARMVQEHAWSCNGAGTPPPNNKDRDEHTGGGAAKSGDGKFVNCPVCWRSFPQHAIESHAWVCVPSTRRKQQGSAHVGIEGAAASVGPTSSPAGAGKGAKKTKEDRSPGPITGTRRASTSLLSRGCNVNLVHDGPQSRKLTDPCRGGQQGDVVQTLMEAGKRAGKAEKELRIVPPAWPVERIEDILPAEMADRLLARLLHTSRDWTSRPWYNANGTPGLTHKRSCTYRIPSDRDNGSSIGNSDKSSSGSRKSSSIPGTDHDQTRPTRASDETQRRAGSGTTDLPDGVTEAERSGGKCTGLMERRSEDGTDDIVQSSSEDESFDCGFTEAGKVGGGGGGGGVGPPGSTAVMERSTPADSEAKDSAGTSWVDDDQGAAVAPEELLEVVPLVVEAVRRRQRRRVEEGLGGHEGLGWNPNFCICNVYDDHRNHLGPHSDTLSSIGPEAIVVGISLGAKRVFVVQEKLPWGVKAAAGGDLEGKKKCLDMPHNSAVVMWGGCQERYKHGVPSMTKGVEIHPMAGTKRISITLRERKETLPRFLLPIPDCRCGAPTSLNSRVLENGTVEYLFHCDRARGACGFTVFKGPRR